LLAGWLFADLCLVIFVVSLASAPSTHTAAMHSATHPTNSSPTPTPTPTLTRSPQPRTLERTPADFYINVAPADFNPGAVNEQAAAELLKDINREVAGQHMQGHQAGFVLVFASGPSYGIGQAIASANTVIKLIRSRDPAVFGQVTGEGLWNGQGNNTFHFQIFFYT
jgi:hypothetical protein